MVVSFFAFARAAFGVDGTWIGTSGNWSDTTKWTNGIVASGVGATATINLSLSGNLALTNNTATTNGTLQLANSSGQNFDFYGSGTTLTFDVASGTPLFGVNSWFGKIYTIGAGGLTLAGNKGLKIEVGSNTIRPVTGLAWTGFSGTLEITSNGGNGGWDPQAAGLMPSVNLNLATGAGNLIFGMFNGRNQTIGGLDGTSRAYLNNNSPANGNGTLTVGANDGGGTFAGVVGGDNSNPSKGGVSIAKNGTGTQTFSGVIAGASGTTETVTVNNGTLMLSGSNTYNGLTTVNSGATLKLGHANALGATNGVTKITSGGVLDLNGQTIPEQFGDTNSTDGFVGNGISNSGALINSSGTAAEILGAIYGNAAFTFGSGDIKVNLVNRRNSGVSAVAVTKTNSGKLTIAGAGDNSTMVLIVNGGTAVLAKNSSSSARAASDATIGNGGTIKFDPSQGTVTGSLNWGGQLNATVTLNAGGFLDLNGSSGQNSRFQQLISTDSGGTVTNSSATAAVLGIAARDTATTRTFGGTIKDGVGTVALDFTVTGSLNSGRINLLNGDSSFSGGTSIGFGTVRLGHNNALGTGKITLTSSSGVLDINGKTVANTLANSGSGANILNSSATAATLNGNMTETLISDFTVSGTGDINWNGPIQRSSGIGTITKSGANTVTLGGSIGNSGMNWAVTGGNLVLAKSGALAVGNGLTLNGGNCKLNSAGGSQGQIGDASTVTLTSGTLDLNSFSETIGILAGAGTVKNDAVGTTATLTVGGNNATGGSFPGAIQNGNGTVAFTKEGSGTQTLTGVNSYSGNTTISAGTLALSGSGSIASSLNLMIAKTAKLDASAITPTGYSLPAGTLTIGIDKTSGVLTQGQVVVAGKNLTYAGSLIVTKTGADALTTGDSFTFFTGGSFDGWFGTLTLPTLSSGLAWDTNNLATAGYLDVYDFRTNAIQTMVALKNTATTLKLSKLTGKTAGSRGAVGVQSVNSSSGATVGISGADITYLPPSNFTGTDTFTAILGDGHGSITATVVVTVSEANVGPALAVDNGYQTNGGYGSFTASGLPNTTYDVEVATNPSGPWLPADNDTVAATGAGFISYTDTKTISAYGGTVFYRLRQQ